MRIGAWMRGIAGEQAPRNFYGDGEAIEACYEVRRRVTERCRSGCAREIRKRRGAARFTVRNNSEELLEVNKEGVICSARKNLNACGAAENRIDWPGGNNWTREQGVDRGCGITRLVRSYWASDSYDLGVLRTRERDLENKILDQVLVVVDLDLIKLFADVSE